MTDPHSQHSEPSEPTRKLIEAAKSGNQDAWLHIDRRFRRLLAFLMRGQLKPAARGRFDTDDVLQSVMLCAFREIDSYDYRGRGSFQTWLKAIMENKIKSLIRKQLTAKRDIYRESAMDATEEDGLPVKMIPTPDEIAVAAERSARLMTAITSLPEDQEQILLLHHIDHKTVRDAARELGLPETTARRKLTSALLALQKELVEQNPATGD